MNALRIIRAVRVLALVAFVSALLVLYVPQATAQTCRWDGTAPFCSGECDDNETEITRLGSIPEFWVSPFVNVNPTFGANCVTGSKALCCVTPGLTCRWDGTAPFCNGKCRSDETQANPPAGSSSGAGCLTGSKVYCCSSTGSVGQPLTPDYGSTPWSAVWVKDSRLNQAVWGWSRSDFDVYVGKNTAGFRPIVINNAFDPNGGVHWNGIWVKDGVANDWVYGWARQDFDKKAADMQKQGYRPIMINAIAGTSGVSWNGIWVKDGVANDWVYGWARQDFDKKAADMQKQGYKLLYLE